jgi:hypothetical protein
VTHLLNLLPENQFGSSRAAATFTASLLLSSSVTITTVQSVIEHTGNLINDIVDTFTSDVSTTRTSAKGIQGVIVTGLIAKPV